jgi:hypothetical protein
MISLCFETGGDLVNEFNRNVARVSAFAQSKPMSGAAISKVSELNANGRSNEYGDAKSPTVIREMEIDGLQTIEVYGMQSAAMR